MILPVALARFRREIRIFLWLALVPAAHGILLLLFSVLTQGRGFVTPSGSPDLGFLAFGLLVFATRVAALFVVPLVAAYVVVRRLFG